jgi:hypothetical protein
MPVLCDATDIGEEVEEAFGSFSGVSRCDLDDNYQFNFEHGQWWVLHKPSGDMWSVVETATGIDFERV